MIINHQDRWAYVGINKTASTSLHAYLQQSPFNGQLSGPEEQHRTWLPDGCESYRVLVVVREPYHRALSLWRHARINEMPGIDLPEFLRVCQAACQAGIDPFYGRRQVDFLNNLQSPHIVRLDDLAAGLRQFFGGADIPQIPWLNTTDEGHGLTNYTPELLDLVAQIYRDDFVFLGYPSGIGFQPVIPNS